MILKLSKVNNDIEVFIGENMYSSKGVILSLYMGITNNHGWSCAWI